MAHMKHHHPIFAGFGHLAIAAVIAALLIHWLRAKAAAIPKNME